MPCPDDGTPELTVVQAAPMMLLPPAPGVCPLCAVDHESWQAHNAQSLYYQTRFQMTHGRSAKWSDAIMHCAPAIREQWIGPLRAAGVWKPEDDEALASGTAIAELPPETP